MAKREKPPAKANEVGAPELESRHFEWLFSSAQEHFVDAIERLELDNVRHHSFAAEPYYRNTIVGRESRDEKLQRNELRLAEYRRIVEYCMAVRQRIMQVSAQEFAEQFGRAMTTRKR